MKNGQDKGPFWSGHKRFPTAATYGDHADQWRFLVSATHILSQCMGAQPRKEEGDDDYASSERNEVFAASVAQTCVIPPYIPGTVDKDIEGDASDVATPDNSVDVARAKGLEALQRLSAVNLTAIDVEPADFEKDDDYNFHARSRRFEVLRCLHFLAWTRGHLTMARVVSFSSLSRLGPRLPRRRSTS